MGDEQTNKPRFEPPPWEREAFERFRAEQEAKRRQAELEAPSVAAPEAPVERDASVPAVTTPAAPADAPSAVGGDAKPISARAEGAPLSEAAIDSMLIQLKGEEPSPKRANVALVNAVIGAFAVSGLYIIVQAAVLFAKTRGAEGAVGLLGAVASLVVLLVGIGFLVAGFLLFRKYRL